MASSSTPQTFGRRNIQALPRQPEKLHGSDPARPSAAISVSGAMILAFVGRNQHKFEATIQGMERRDPDFAKAVASWCWPAFFVPVIWLAYRKMWTHAAVAYFATLAVGYLAGGQAWLSLLPYAIFAIYAKSVYARHAASHIRRIIAAQPNAMASAVAIQDDGGVSIGGAWIAVTLMLLPGIAALVHIAATAGA